MNNKTYQDGLRESIEILIALKDVDEKESSAFYLVNKFIEDGDTYRDKNGTKIQAGDFLDMNPDDENYFGFVISYAGNLIFVSELTSREPIRLKDVLQGSDTPSVIRGNLYNQRIEFHEW